jgi:hypothetical protein
MVVAVPGSMEKLERRIDELRAAVRQAAASGDRVRARSLRAELRQTEGEWEEALAELERKASRPTSTTVDASSDGPLLPIREQVHQALTLLSVPAAPRLIVTVYEAFFAGKIVGTRLTSLRRDEERSFRSTPFARPYYVCAALTADLLAPARGLLAVSTWPLRQRVIGPLSPRVDFLTAAIRVAQQVERLSEAPLGARRLLWRFAANIPGAAAGGESVDPGVVIAAANAELEVHAEADEKIRAAAADRARRQLDDVEQLFGTQFRGITRRASGS